VLAADRDEFTEKLGRSYKAMFYHLKSIAFLIALILSCVTCASARQNSITIGVSLSLTGELSQIGAMQEKGYRLWESKINADGGILGKRVHILIKDDHSDVKQATILYQDFITAQKADFIFGPYSSKLTEAVAPIAEKNHYPMLAPGAAADRIWQHGNQYIFGMWTPASQYTLGFLEMLVVYGIDNISVLTAEDSFSYSIAEGTREWAPRLGLTIKSFDKIPKGTHDLRPYVKKVKAIGSNVLILTGHYNEALDITKAITAVSFKPKLLLATVGPVFDEYYEKLKADTEGVCSISIWEPNPLLNFPGSQKFAKTFKHIYGINPTYHAATAYAAGEILAKAIEKAGNMDREKVRSILSAMSTNSIIGRYGVDRTGLQVKRFPLCIQWQHGKKEIVWPEELRTAEPIISQ
jgi:branched-chain amino acid transport system substrate-binding protein